jgi:hypothetical protein
MAQTPKLQNSSFFKRDDLEKYLKSKEFKGFISFTPHKLNSETSIKSGEINMRQVQ